MAVNFDAYTLDSWEWNNGSTGRSFSHTFGGDNRYVFIDIKSDRSKTEGNITGVTVDGVAADFIVSVLEATSGWRHWRYKLLAPASGSKTVKVTFLESGTAKFRIAVQSFKDVNQTDPIGTTVTGTKSWGTGTMTLTVTGITDGMISDSCGCYIGAGDPSVGSGQTLTYNATADFKGSYKLSVSGSNSTTWTLAANGSLTGISTPLKPVAGGVTLLAEEIEEEY